MNHKCSVCGRSYKANLFCSVKNCACEGDETALKPNVNTEWFKTYKIINVRTKKVVLETSDRKEAVGMLKQNEADYHAKAWNNGQWHDIGGHVSLEAVAFI